MATGNLSTQQMRTLLALVLQSDKPGIVNLLNLNGVDVGMDSTDKTITIAFLKAIKDSATFRAQTVSYLENWVNQNRQNFLGRPHVGFLGNPHVGSRSKYQGFVTRKIPLRGGQQTPIGKFSFVDDPPKNAVRGGKPAPMGKFAFIDDMAAHPNPRSSRTVMVPRFNSFVEQPRDIIDFVQQPDASVLGFGSDSKKAVHIKRNFVEQPRDIIDFVNQPQDIMAYSGAPKKMRGGFLREDGPTVIFNSDTGDNSDDGSTLSDAPPQAFNPSSMGLANPNPGYSGVGTVTGPSQVTLQQASATPAQVAAAQQATGVTPTTASSSSSGSFLGGLFSSGNVSKLLTTGLNAYSTGLTNSANQTSEQNALALEQYKLAEAQQAGINASTSTWPAWATVAIAVVAIGSIALVVSKMRKAGRARAAAAGK